MPTDNINKNRKEAAKSMAQFLYDMYKEKQETSTIPAEDDVLVIPTKEEEPE